MVKKRMVFILYKLDEDGTGNYFETDQDIDTTPTLSLVNKYNPWILRGKINRILHQLNPTNAVTYTLMLWQAAIANNYESHMNLLWSSAAARADDELYDNGELNIPFNLETVGTLYYSVDWSGAPGDTPGFVLVSGEAD